ncbi:MAG TPA: hypothetical protein VFO49_02430 [Nocardioides sp.]|jgi:hypothetical protein|nr:hypothetical protein [Nocardioides sp.]
MNEARGLGLVLPGRGYTPAAPLLAFASQALEQHGYAVEQVWWDARQCPDDDQDGWVRDQASAAMTARSGVPPPTVVVAKSLGTRAAPWAAEQGYDAIWLTPLLFVDDLVAGIAAHPGRQLLVCGQADEAWDADAAAGLGREGCDVMEIPDADHGLCVPGDVVRSAEIHVEVARRMVAFLAEEGPA